MRVWGGHFMDLTRIKCDGTSNSEYTLCHQVWVSVWCVQITSISTDGNLPHARTLEIKQNFFKNETKKFNLICKRAAFESATVQPVHSRITWSISDFLSRKKTEHPFQQSTKEHIRNDDVQVWLHCTLGKEKCEAYVWPSSPSKPRSISQHSLHCWCFVRTHSYCSGWIMWR